MPVYHAVDTYLITYSHTMHACHGLPTLPACHTTISLPFPIIHSSSGGWRTWEGRMPPHMPAMPPFLYCSPLLPLLPFPTPASAPSLPHVPLLVSFLLAYHSPFIWLEDPSLPCLGRDTFLCLPFCPSCPPHMIPWPSGSYFTLPSLLPFPRFLPLCLPPFMPRHSSLGCAPFTYVPIWRWWRWWRWWGREECLACLYLPGGDGEDTALSWERDSLPVHTCQPPPPLAIPRPSPATFPVPAFPAMTLPYPCSSAFTLPGSAYAFPCLG